MKTLRAALARIRPTILSLDLFDTVLLRTTRPEVSRLGGIARVQARALGRPDLYRDLYRARLAVQKALYDDLRKTRTGEVTHRRIVQGMAERCGLADGAAAILAEAEVTWEQTALRPNQALLSLVRDQRRRGMRVILVSDMYLPGADLARLVAAHAPDLADVMVFSSADAGCSKRYGTLYPWVEQHLGLPGSAFFHVGDNAQADGRMAAEAGWRSHVIPRPAWWRWLHDVRDRRARAGLARRGWIVLTPPPA